MFNMLLLDAAPQGGSSISGILMIVAMIVIFYFFMIRPQSKKQKEIKKMREALKPGSKVVTAGGIHGKIHEITDNYMVIEVADGVKIRVDKGSIYAATETPVNNK
jgi:preprotein translocase subunit YajC